MYKPGANEFVSFLQKNKNKINTKGNVTLPELVEVANNYGYKCTVDELSGALLKIF